METVEDAILGKLLYIPKMQSQMKKWGLYHWMIVDTFKYGHDVTAIIPELLQKHYRLGGEKEIEVLYSTKRKDGKPLEGILLISCWSKTIK